MYYNYVVAFAEREVDMGHEIPSRAHLTQNDNFTLLRGPVGGVLWPSQYSTGTFYVIYS